ncbi:MAG: glycosyltransferase family 2 protein [Bacilli bacterium]|nr:glycosyltransferase family 2 protein [Bacilli bacterium]
MEKIITFLVPAYNAEPYLDKCLGSLVKAGEEAEIIVIDDGSKDKTPQIADRWQAEYPNIIRVVHQENGGHGEGINVGMKLATGLYFKVVDADDWLDEEALKVYLQRIREMRDAGKMADMVFTGFVFDQVSTGKQKAEWYDNIFKIRDQVIEWNQIRFWRVTQILMIHAITFRTQMLKDANFALPKHRFYEDNVYVYMGTFNSKNLAYFRIPLYHYYVGREGQSINIDVMAARYQQQIDNMEQIALAYTWDEIKKLPRMHKKTMVHLLVLYLALTLNDISIKNTKETYKHYKVFTKRWRTENPSLYWKMNVRNIWLLTNLLIRPIRTLATRIGYKLVYRSTNWG